jgi:hypothetical protein
MSERICKQTFYLQVLKVYIHWLIFRIKMPAKMHAKMPKIACKVTTFTVAVLV